jgi:hypothetical protein
MEHFNKNSIQSLTVRFTKIIQLATRLKIILEMNNSQQDSIQIFFFESNLVQSFT